MLLLKGVQIFTCKSNEVKWTQMELFTHPWLQRLTREELAGKVMSVGLKALFNHRRLNKDVLFV